MSRAWFSRHVVVGLGSAAGALAVAALLGTTPVASAEGNDSNAIDYGALAAPAATYPLFQYNNQFDVFSGNTDTTYLTTFDGIDSPVTKTITTTLDAGTVYYGSSDTFEASLLTSATTGYDYEGVYDAVAGTTPSGFVDYFLPLESVFNSF